MKAAAKAILSTHNSKNNGNKVINQYIGLSNLVFATFVIANYTSNSNLAIPKKIPLVTAIFIFNKFFAIFAIFANTTFERKPKLC